MAQTARFCVLVAQEYDYDTMCDEVQVLFLNIRSLLYLRILM